MQDTLHRLLWTAAAVWTPTQQRRIFERCQELPEDLDGWLELGRECELSESRLLAFRKKRDFLERDENVTKARKKGVNVLATRHFLRERELLGWEDLPPVLFYRGDSRRLGKPGVAIVGARKATSYGREIARRIATEAVGCGRLVVSGAAYGIDAAAHQAALDAGGCTVAVMGCGLLHDYPKEHAGLLDRIAESGLVVSQFPPETAPLGRNFVIRNRLIAALSRDVVIVEGTSRSGARHTADFATKLKRRLWAVPGEIGKANSELPLELLVRGARLVSSPGAPFEEVLAGEQTTLRFETDDAPVVSETREPPEDATARGVLEALTDGSLTVDEIGDRLTLSPAAVSVAITFLELEGWIEKGGDGCYRAHRLPMKATKV